MRERIPTTGLALLTLLTLAPAARSQEGEAIRGRIQAYLAPFIEAEQLSGSLLIARGDTVLYEGSFGLANRELEVPVDSATRFNIASITKPMTQIVVF